MEQLPLSNQTQVNLCSQAWMPVQVQPFRLLRAYCVKLYTWCIIKPVLENAMETRTVYLN